MDVEFDKIFEDDYLQDILSKSKLLPKDINTTRKIKELLNKDIPKNMIEIIQFVKENSPILDVIKKINKGEQIENFGKRENTSTEYEISKNENLIDIIEYLISSKKSKFTNEQGNRFNQDLFNSFQDEDLNFGKYSVKFDVEKFCGNLQVK